MKDLKLNKALSVVELEERFEMTVASADADRCDNNTVVIRLV